MALNYGSRDEIIYTVNKLKKFVTINEKILMKTCIQNIPEPEILIRTGNSCS